MKFTMSLGISVKSKTTDFLGVVTARSENLYGCNRYYVNPKVDKDGKLTEGAWFDEEDLVELSKIKRIVPIPAQTGGPISKIK